MSKECKKARNIVVITMLILAVIIAIIDIWVVG